MSKLILIMVVLLLLFMASAVTVKINQKITYSTNLTCEELRDCIVLNFPCLNRRVDNKFLMFEWGFNQSSLMGQREYYINNCLKKVK